MTGGPQLASQVAEHVPSLAGGGFVVWLGHFLRDWFRNRKPLEDKAGSVVDSFSNLTDHLERRIDQQDRQIEAQAQQIMTLNARIDDYRQTSHSLRNDVQKVRGYADALLRYAGRLEEQALAAGLPAIPRPELPVLS